LQEIWFLVGVKLQRRLFNRLGFLIAVGFNPRCNELMIYQTGDFAYELRIF
jgi:hypothetical protein